MPSNLIGAAAVAVLAVPLPAAAMTLTDAFLGAVARGAYARPSAEAVVVEPLVRLAPADHGPGGAPAGADRPSPRAISNALAGADLARVDPAPLSNWSVGWAQFMMSHDLARSPAATGPGSAIDVPVAADDPVARDVGGRPVMVQRRSALDPATGEPFSDVTPWLDASTVYGSTAARELELRAMDGSGRLRTAGDGGLMVKDGRRYAGDDRADENLVLLSVHELMMKEHNRLADAIAAGCATTARACSGDAIYFGARAVNVAVQQKILFEEFVPAFLGTTDLASLVPDVALLEGAGVVINAFTAAAGRIGHTKVPALVLAGLPGEAVRSERLEDCVFSSACHAGESLGARVHAAIGQPSEPVDTVVTPALRNALIETPGRDVLIDLLASNVNRGRDHGLPDYLATRAALGFGPAPVEALLPGAVVDIYGGGEVDLIVGLFAETPVAGSQLGETGSAIWAIQLRRLEGDPAFYTRLVGDPIDALLDGWGMAQVIAANTSLTLGEIGDPFRAAPAAIPLPPALAGAGLGMLAMLALRRRTGARAPVPDGRARGAGLA